MKVNKAMIKSEKRYIADLTFVIENTKRWLDRELETADDNTLKKELLFGNELIGNCKLEIELSKFRISELIKNPYGTKDWGKNGRTRENKG